MGSQKLTKMKKKIDDLLALDKITYDDLKELSEEELSHFSKATTERLNNTKGIELDKFTAKIDPVLSQESRNDIWENNHRKIIQEITSFINDYGRMPLKVDLAQRVGLSRQTLYKHFKEYKNNSLYQDHFDSFRLMTEKLMAKMFQFALRGDVKAARLYFDMLSRDEKDNSIKSQTNYIQVNNLIISEEELKALSQDELEKIEEIIVGQKKIL